MKTKLYELIIPPDMNPIVINRENDDNKIECHLNLDEYYLEHIRSHLVFSCLPNTEVIYKKYQYYTMYDLIHDINIRSHLVFSCLPNTEVIYKKYQYYTMYDLIHDINDDLISLQNYVLNLIKNTNWYRNPEMLTIAHRKHPTRQNIRQVAWFIAKTDRPVHWID